MDEMWQVSDVITPGGAFARVQLLCCLPRNFPVFLLLVLIIRVLL